MSNTIDNRVVSMEFDNARFQRNIEESVQSLRNLDKTLYGMKDSVASVGKVNDALQRLDFAHVEAALDQTAKGFTHLEYFAAGAMYRIGEDAVLLGKKLIKELAIDQITAGWGKYEDKTTSVQTIMSATGQSIEYVSEQLDRLNWFTDETSYSFTDMTGNIAKFTAQQIPLEEAVTAMEGIATWAAKSGQNAQTASRAMYNFSQALGVGYMSVADWKSIELANMATTEFKQLVIDTAVEMGKLHKVGDAVFSIDPDTLKETEVTLENFRTTLKDRWFDTSVINATLNKYGEFADALSKVVQKYEDYGLTATRALYYTNQMALGMDVNAQLAEEFGDAWGEIGDELAILSEEEYKFGREAFAAAQEAKTLKEAIDATKDAASTVWMNLFENLIGGYDKAKKFFTNVANELYDIFVEPVNEINNVIVDAFGSNWDKIAKGVTSAGGDIETFKQIVIDLGSKTKENFANSIEAAGGFDDALQKGIISLDDLRNGLRAMRDGDYLKEVGTGARKAVDDVETLNEVVKGVLVGDYKNGMGPNGERRNALLAAGYDPDLIQEFAEKVHKGVALTEADLKRYQEAVKPFLQAEGDAIDGLNDILDQTYGMEEGVMSRGEKLRQSITGIINIIGTLFGQIREGFGEAFGNDSVTGLQNIVDNIYDFVQRAKEVVEQSTVVKEVAFTIGKIIKTIITLLGSLFKVAKTLFDNLLGPVLKVVIKIISQISAIINDIVETVAPAIDWITDKVGSLFSGIGKGINIVAKFIDIIKGLFRRDESEKEAAITRLTAYLEKKSPFLLNVLGNLRLGLMKIKNEIVWIFHTISEKLQPHIDKLKEILKLDVIIEKIQNGISKLNTTLAPIIKEIKEFFQSDEFKNSKIVQFVNKIINQVKVLWKTIKEFDLKQYIDDLKDRFLRFWKSIKDLSIPDKIAAIVNKVKEKFQELWDNIFKNINTQDWDQMFAKILTTISNFVTNAWQKISQFFKDIKQKISDAVTDLPGTFEKIKKIFVQFKDELREKFPLTFDIVVGALSGLWNALKTMVINLKNKIVAFFKGDDSMKVAGTEFFGNFFEGIKLSFPKISGVITKIKEFATNLTSSFDLTTNWNKILDNVGNFGAFIGKVSGVLKNIGVGVGAALGGAGLASLLGKTKSMSETVKGVVSNFAGMEKSIAKFFDAYRTEKMSKSFVNIGQALILIAATILILIGGLYALSKIPKDDIIQGIAIISVLLFELGAVMAAMFGMLAIAKSNGGAIGVTGAFLSVVALIASLLIMAKAIQKFYDIPEDVWKTGGGRILLALTVMAGIMSALILFSKGGVNGNIITTQSDLKGIGIAFIGLSLALSLIINVLKKVYKMVDESDPSKLNTAVGIIEGLMLFIGVMTLLAGKGGANLSQALAALGLVASIAILVELIKSIKELCTTYGDTKDLETATGIVIALGAVMAALLFVVSKYGAKELATAAASLIQMVGIVGIILALAYAMKLIAEVLPAFDNVSTEGFARFAGTLVTICVTIAGVSYLLSQASVGILALAALLGVIALDVLAGAAAFFIISESMDEFVESLERLNKIKFNEELGANLSKFFAALALGIKGFGSNGIDRILGSIAFMDVVKYLDAMADTLIKFARNWNIIDKAFGDSRKMSTITGNIGKLYAVVRSKGDWVYDSYNYEAIGKYISELGNMVDAISQFSRAYDDGDLDFFEKSQRDVKHIADNIKILFDAFADYSGLSNLAVSNDNKTILENLFETLRDFSENENVLKTFGGQNIDVIASNIGKFYAAISEGVKSMLTDVSTVEMDQFAGAMSKLIATADEFVIFWSKSGSKFSSYNFDHIGEQFSGMTSALADGFTNIETAGNSFYAASDAGNNLKVFAAGLSEYVTVLRNNGKYLQENDLSSFATSFSDMLSVLGENSDVIHMFGNFGIGKDSINIISYVADGITSFATAMSNPNILSLIGERSKNRLLTIGYNLKDFFNIIGDMDLGDKAKLLGMSNSESNVLTGFATGIGKICETIESFSGLLDQQDKIAKFKVLSNDFINILHDNEELFYSATSFDDGSKLLTYVNSLDYFVDVLDKFATVATNSSLDEASTTRLTSFITNIQTLLDTLSGSSGAGSIVDGLGLDSIGNGLLNLNEFITEYTKSGQNMDWDKFNTGLSNLFAIFSGNNIGQAITNFDNFVGGKSIWTNGGFKDLLTSVSQFASIGTISNGGFTILDQLITDLEKFSKIGDNVDGKSEKILGEIKKLEAGLNNGELASVAQMFENFGAELLDRLGLGFEKAVDGTTKSEKAIPFNVRIISKLNSAAQKVLDSEALKVKFASVGTYAAEGIIVGLNTKGDDLNEAISNLCRNMISAAKNTLREHSPSRVFMQIGEYVSEGMAIGVKDKASNAEASVETMAESTIDTMKYAMDHISSVLNSDSSLVITPVFDMSNVEAGAAEISSLLGDRPMALSGRISQLNAQIQNSKLKAPSASLVSLDEASLSRLIPQAMNNNPIDVNVTYSGSLAYLAQVLQPAIEIESNRVGNRMVR